MLYMKMTDRDDKTTLPKIKIFKMSPTYYIEKKKIIWYRRTQDENI